MVKLSDEDAAWLYPGVSLEAAAGRILTLGAGLAVVTRGGEGSLLATPATQLFIPAIRSTVADTIGAGDSYMAALIYGLLSRRTEGLGRDVLTSIGQHGVEGSRHHGAPAGRQSAHGRRAGGGPAGNWPGRG